MSSPKKLELVSLDVGGKIFKTKMETLTKYPDSALARMFTDPVIEESLTKTENGEYFLDVDPDDFEVIMKFLRHGDPFLRILFKKYLAKIRNFRLSLQ